MPVLNYIVFTLFIIKGFTHPTVNEENSAKNYDYYDDSPKELNILNYNNNNNDHNISLEEITNICIKFNDRLIIVHNNRTINCQLLKENKSLIRKRESNLNDLKIDSTNNNLTNTENYTIITDKNNINIDNSSNIDLITTTIKTTPSITFNYIETTIGIKLEDNNDKIEVPLEIDTENKSTNVKNVSSDTHPLIILNPVNKTRTNDSPVTIQLRPISSTTEIYPKNQTALKTEKTTTKDVPLIINLTIPEIPNENNKTTQFHPKTTFVGNSAGKSMIKPEDTNNINDTKLGSEEPAEPVTKASSKDTSILIFLLVAVVTVGLLAFAYNFIKKRKRQTADLERVERHNSNGSPPKRDLLDADPQEMKPLMTPQQNLKQSDDANNKNVDHSDN